MSNDPIVIVGSARTPMGGMQGDFSELVASELRRPSRRLSSVPAWMQKTWAK